MITASIVTYRTDPQELGRCLCTLADSGVQRVYVIDNAREEVVAQVCGEHGAEYIPHENVGYGAAHNVAIGKAIVSNADYHVVLNSDIEFDSGIIGQIAEYMAECPDVGQLQPRIVCPDRSLQRTCRLVPTPMDVFVRRFLPSEWFRASRKRYLLGDADWSKEFDCAYQQGSFMFFRVEALKEVGAFDERYFMYPEDIDLSRRMASAGWRVRYWPGVTVVHYHRRSSYKSLRMLWIHASNMMKYFNKWGWFFDPERRRLNDATLSQFR